ncbi:hypothetical protein PRIPAC_70408 [Pristionchus pacificus]|uniref:Flavoprotein domain-containing protein n=1 Tax=Pristionchus pacificus TaxID=54126 RepID=A0A2A6BRF5_PRIPA|nr:hypothetical protein PRIPAC_70408 [Pristionchus pacificus]|eukprot:PDM68485.1 hypothetical protein PRIPAC_43987 [Pristionchus pacificus]
MTSQEPKEDYEPAIKKAKDGANDEQLATNGPAIHYYPGAHRRAPFDNTHKIKRVGGKYHLLLGVTGSVAAIKLQELIEQLHKMVKDDRLWIKIVATDSAFKFLEKASLQIAEVIYEDRDEWSMWNGRGDPVLHIELRKWADAMLIAPLDANTMAKLANGLCDNLLTSIVRAWDPEKLLHFAPAMNSFMWDSTLTYQHRATLRDLLRYKEIPPIEKDLMCGDSGMGAMATIQLIASIISSNVKSKFAVITG